jgi:kynurenine formamidase
MRFNCSTFITLMGTLGFLLNHPIQNIYAKEVEESMILTRYKIVDLTQPLYSAVPTWNGSCGFCLEMTQDYDQMFCVQQINMQAGVGTHMDAPSHRIQGGASISEIPIVIFVVPICMIDVSKKAGADYEISVQDIQNYETEYGLIPSHSLVIAFTGWSRFWMDPDAYRNKDATGHMHFPAFSAQSAEYLLQRDIAGIAIDTLSPDCMDPDFTVHNLILGKGKYIIENIADCSALPPKGSYAIALPLRIENGTESPMRIIALIPPKI